MYSFSVLWQFSLFIKSIISFCIHVLILVQFMAHLYNYISSTPPPPSCPSNHLKWVSACISPPGRMWMEVEERWFASTQSWFFAPLMFLIPFLLLVLADSLLRPYQAGLYQLCRIGTREKRIKSCTLTHLTLWVALKSCETSLYDGGWHGVVRLGHCYQLRPLLTVIIFVGGTKKHFLSYHLFQLISACLSPVNIKYRQIYWL